MIISIEDRAFKLGVSLGDSSDQVKNSIDSINDLEKTRNLIFLNKTISGVEDASSFVLKNASNLFEDLVDSADLGQEDQEDLLVPIKNFKKVKVKSNRVTVRRSSRLNK
jgi:hypothetical protein